MKNKKIYISIISVVLLAVAGWYFYDFFADKTEKVAYVDFYSAVEDGEVKSVTVSENNLTFEKTNGEIYSTQNPESPTLKEFLLKNSVEVKIEKNSAEIFSLIFDCLFYIFFFGVIIIAFRKFISPNTFKVQHNTGVTFDDVVGMDRLKQDMKQVMEIMKHPAEYAKKGIRMPKGILLEGEPGNGKTLFAIRKTKSIEGEAFPDSTLPICPLELSA